MKVTLLEPFGYCSGVERAMKLALKTKEENPNKNVVVLGMLVHNQDSLKALEKAGISTIYKQNCSLEQMINYIEEPSIVILTAHGHSKIVEKKLMENGHQIIDATCPFVQNSFKEISKAIDDGKEVFYIGVNNHPEANAAISLDKNVHLIDAKESNIPNISSKELLVISQTTLSAFEVEKIIGKIKEKYPSALIIEGICNASTNRQKSIMNISSDVDGIIVVGGSNSNNSKTLFNIAQKLYPNKIIKLVQNENEINKKDLIGLSHIAISSGASTPKEVVLSIKAKLLN